MQHENFKKTNNKLKHRISSCFNSKMSVWVRKKSASALQEFKMNNGHTTRLCCSGSHIALNTESVLYYEP